MKKSCFSWHCNFCCPRTKELTAVLYGFPTLPSTLGCLFFFKHSCLQHANKNPRSFNTAICLLKTSKPFFFFQRASFEPAQSANSRATPRCVLCRQNKTTVHCEDTGIFLSQVLNLALLHPSDCPHLRALQFQQTFLLPSSWVEGHSCQHGLWQGWQLI